MQYFKIIPVDQQLAEAFLDDTLVVQEEIVRRTFKRPRIITLLKSEISEEAQMVIADFINKGIIVLKYEDEDTITYQNCKVIAEDTEEYYESINDLINKDYEEFAKAEEADVAEEWE